MFVDGKVIYYTGWVFTQPSNQGKKRRTGPAFIFPATPQVF